MDSVDVICFRLWRIVVLFPKESTKQIHLYSQSKGLPITQGPTLKANVKLDKAFVEEGAQWLVLVMSTATGYSKDAPPTQVYESLKPVLVGRKKVVRYLMLCCIEFPKSCGYLSPMGKLPFTYSFALYLERHVLKPRRWHERPNQVAY